MTPPEPPVRRTPRVRLPEWEEAPPPDDPERAWRNGYVWMRLARYDHAWAWWSLVDDPGLAARVLVSRASSLRELRLHRSARIEDETALNAGLEGGWEHASALIGLVADAVGEDDRESANARLADAIDAVRQLPDDLASDRQRIRLGWVACEVALLTGGIPAVALPHVDRDGQVAVPDVYRAGSDHHVAKGLLFSGVLARDPGPLDAAAELAPPGLLWAVHLARADHGVDGARAEARRAWERVVVPTELADAVTPPSGVGTVSGGGR